MGKLRSVFRFEIPGLLVQTDLLGGTVAFDLRGARVDITLPITADDLGGSAAANPRRKAIWGRSAGMTDGRQFVSVRIVQVVVVSEVATDLAAFDRDDKQQRDVVFKAFTTADGIAKEALRNLLDLVRTKHGQSWLPATGESLEHVGVQAFFDHATGVRLPMGLPIELSVRVDIAQTGLEPTSLVELQALLARATGPDLARFFLADARHALFDLDVPDPARALLLSAIALEVSVAATLRAVASPTQLELVELLLGKLADTSFSTRALLSQGLDATIGRSLKGELPALFGHVDVLMNTRNDLVHRGIVPEFNVARRALLAAEEAIDWLQGIRAPAKA